jgi:hypothetical protein
MSTVVHLLASASSIINSSASAACGSSCNQVTIQTIFKSVANLLIFLVGSVSVIMIIIGALRYVTSNGDSKQVGAAKDTILYAVVGIIVAIASYAIVHFVTGAF